MRYFFDLFNAAHSEVLRAVEPANCQQLLGAGIGPYVELACLAGTERCGDKKFCSFGDDGHLVACGMGAR